MQAIETTKAEADHLFGSIVIRAGVGDETVQITLPRFAALELMADIKAALQKAKKRIEAGGKNEA
jgi:hypothetical protein